MTEVLFHASCVAIEDEDSVSLVGFADREIGTTHYFILERAHEFDTQDRDLGMDTYYIERDDQSFSCYGGIVSYAQHPDRIRFELDDKASRKLGVGRTLQITFDIDRARSADLAKKLALILAENACESPGASGVSEPD